jgi:acylphosphatase
MRPCRRARTPPRRVHERGGMNATPHDHGDGSVRLRLRVRGAVQGVGFRPFVYRLARRFALAGFVRNDANGVLCEIEGIEAPRFVAALQAEVPTLGRIDAVDVGTIPTTGDADFVILDSVESETRTRIVRMPRPARTAVPSCSIRRAVSISIRSSPARHAGRGSRSPTDCPMTAPAPRCPRSRCATIARATTAIPTVVAFMPRRSPARRAGRGSRTMSARSSPPCAAGSSSHSRASAAFI